MNEYFNVKHVKEMVDSRELAKINDECAAKWKSDEDYHFFNVQRLSNNKLGLIKDNEELDLDDAYHAVVISN